MTIEVSEYVIDAIADAVVNKMQTLKIGHWCVNEWGNITCSRCGCTALYDKVKVIQIKTTFCPICGAKMQ